MGIHNYLSRYRKQITLRAIIKGIPWGGEAVDFWLTKKFKVTEPVTIDHWTKEPYSSRLQAIESMIAQPPFKENVVFRNYSFTPYLELIYMGHLPLDDKQKKLSKRHARVLREKQQPDDPCAVLIQGPIWTDDPVSFYYHSLFYSEILALREQGQMLKILSANVVVFCEDDRCVLAHRRSGQSADFPRTLHTFGGAYMPPAERICHLMLGQKGI